MKYLKVNNLRCLRAMPKIELKPLTLLVGRNSSGKSTFLRTFPLFRQSIEKRTNAPLLFFGDFVDFGTFEDAYCKSAESRDEGCVFRSKLNMDSGAN